MKTITLKPSDSGPIQQVYVGEGTPTIPTQQKTINHVSEENPKWPRNLQLSDEYIFLKRYGCPAVGMHVDDFVRLCANAEPLISWPPIFVKNEIVQGEVVTVTAIFVEKNPELTEAQNAITYKWQQGDDNGTIWADIEDNETYSGCKSNVLTIQNKSGDKARVLRCVATNAAGSRGGSPVVSHPLPPEKPSPKNP